MELGAHWRRASRVLRGSMQLPDSCFSHAAASRRLQRLPVSLIGDHTTRPLLCGQQYRRASMVLPEFQSWDDMSTFLDHIRLVPFAVDTWSPEGMRIVRQTHAGLELDCPFPCVSVDMSGRSALRLNNTRFDLDGLPDLTDSGGSEAIYIRDLVKRQCRPWDPQGHRLIDRYFEVLDELMVAHAVTLNDAVAPFHGLYDAKHWLFSAPRPYPRAHLLAPADPIAAELSPDDFVMVDFAFFLGPAIVALLPAQSGLTPRKARERQERLARAGVKVMTFAAADLAGNACDFFSRALAPRLPCFWEDDPVPVGPFRPAAIED